MTEKRNKDRNVPTLRFTGFEDEWQKVRLGDLCDLITKGTTPQNFVESGIRFIKIESFEHNEINSKKCLFIDEVTHNKTLKRSILKENDILFAIAGATIGKVNIVKKSILPANTNQALAIIRLGKQENNHFILQVLKSPAMEKYIKESISVGAQPNLNLEQMNNFQFFKPSSREQEKIANFLLLINSRIETQNKIIEELKLLKSTLCNQLIVENSGLPNKVSDIATLGRGRVISSREINQSKPIYPVYSSQTSNDGIMGYLDKYDFDGEYITWTTDGANAGTVFYRNGKFNCTNVCGVLKIKNPSMNNAVFISLALQRQTKKFVSTNLANPKLMNNVMAGITLDLPEIEMQNKIARIILGIETKISNEIQYLAKLAKQKTYLLNKLFK